VKQDPYFRERGIMELSLRFPSSPTTTSLGWEGSHGISAERHHINHSSAGKLRRIPWPKLRASVHSDTKEGNFQEPWMEQDTKFFRIVVLWWCLLPLISLVTTSGPLILLPGAPGVLATLLYRL
jgi:hypothetical protein